MSPLPTVRAMDYPFVGCSRNPGSPVLVTALASTAPVQIEEGAIETGLTQRGGAHGAGAGSGQGGGGGQG